MIKKDKSLRVVGQFDMPADEVHATEVVLTKTSFDQDATLFYLTTDQPMLELGKGTATKMFDMEKLEEDGVYTFRRSYGGSGAFYGAGTNAYAFQIDKQSFIDGYNVKAGDAYIFFNNIIVDVLRSFGINVKIESNLKRQRSAACIHLAGRGEIIDENGNKMHVSVFKEDELTFSVAGIFLLDNSWLNVYNYIKVPEVNKFEPASISDHVPITHKYMIFDRLIDELARYFELSFENLTEKEKDAVQGIKHLYRIN